MTQLVPHIGESVEDLPETLFETAPTVLFTVPRYLQKLAAQVLVQAGSSSAVKRFAYDRAMAFARGHVKRRWAGTRHGADALAHAAWRAAVFRPVLNKIGFDKLELVVSGGAPLPAETMAVWHMLGVNVCEMYGQTETAGGIIAGQRGPFPRPGDVGTVPEGFEVKLADDGEILVRSADLFEGYWNNPEASDAVLGSDGWMRTGDVGEWRDGNLKLVDRARDFLVTSGGKTISPSFIENTLRASPYLAEAIVFGHGRKYLAALIEIDFETVADWARRNDVAYTGFTSLAQHPRVRGPDQARDRQGQRAARARRADQGVPHPAQGARPRGGGRAGHADAQGQAQGRCTSGSSRWSRRCTTTRRRDCWPKARPTRWPEVAWPARKTATKHGRKRCFANWLPPPWRR